ncbi:unnamed protein product [Durusdinium trenchii]|uniref:Uncharacterized protein n=2 Tax=Durusdinium trenchii TaxID=1381693 RepID=A0ABP0QQ28_9DINO
MRRMERRQVWPALLLLSVSFSYAWAPMPRSRVQLQASLEQASSQGRLPQQLLTGVLSQPEIYQDSFLMGFIRDLGDRWTSSAWEPQASSREALVAAVRSFIQRGQQEMQLFNNYVENELGRIIGDPYVFDLRIKILDNGARKALKRAARQAMMDEMLAQSKAKRAERASVTNTA